MILDWKRRLELKGRKSRRRANSEKRDDCVQPRVRLAGRKMRGMGKQGCPRPINRHAAPKAVGCWGPQHFALAPSLLC